MLKCRPLYHLFCLMIISSSSVYADNQTADVTPVIVNGELPYQVSVVQASFTLPSGIQSYVSAIYEGKWLLLAGRTNGLHNFNNDNNNFPPSAQNTVVYVVDPVKEIVYSKSLSDPSSGLTQAQIDLLSVTSAQSYQTSDHLYMCGGYGVDTSTGTFSTKPILTSIDIKGFMHWVMNPFGGETAVEHIRQMINPIFQVAGGYMACSNPDLSLLIYGQNFQGYYVPGSNGIYTEQVRRFAIKDHQDLKVSIKDPSAETPRLEFRRRDLNVVPVIHHLFGTPLPAYIAYSGVFTLTGGAWTVPVLIDYWGNGVMADPEDPATFKQAMNNYDCAFCGLYSKDLKTMFVTLFGGISYGYFENGVFNTDSELPFINQITTITFDEKGIYTQYLMEGEYPVIPSTGSNPGNTLLFGAASTFFPVDGLSQYDNKVLKLDKFGKEPLVIGYIVGGIMSTLPNTNSSSDSTASPYIFKVILQRTL